MEKDREEYRKKLYELLGKEVSGVIDRPLGSIHPKFKNIIYKVNYGYIEGFLAPDNEEQDAYYLGNDKPVDKFKGFVIAIIERKDDKEDKLVVAPKGTIYTDEEIESLLFFQEQYFVHCIIRKVVNVKGNKYSLLGLLGKGKGGYSYLGLSNDKKVVVKMIHHEPCDYYHFGNKIEAEKNDYQRLLKAHIKIPQMIDIDIENEVIVKEYIDGPTIFDLLASDISVERYLSQVTEMARLAKEKNINIDYFPTNFVVNNDTIYYIDYECNEYMEEWNFVNWGIKYWSKTKEFIEYLKSYK